jgi:hypothetical protein
MTRFLFTTDGLLCERASGGERRVLARVAEGPDGALRLSAGAEHRIVPCAGVGWAFELRDREDVGSGGFAPFRLRRGGRLRVGEFGLSLCSRPGSHGGWTFSAPDGPDVEATVTAPDGSATPSPGAVDGAAARGAVVTLEAEGPHERALAIAPVLALGCWLIVRWHTTPASDHALAPPPAGVEVRERGGSSAAGIEAPAAN